MLLTFHETAVVITQLMDIICFSDMYQSDFKSYYYHRRPEHVSGAGAERWKYSLTALSVTPNHCPVFSYI